MFVWHTQAMLAVVGILTVEYLGKGPWWTAPVAVCRRPLVILIVHNILTFFLLAGQTSNA